MTTHPGSGAGEAIDVCNFAQCSASTSDSVNKVEKLPGCNPIQSGPARATVVSGAGCDASQAAICEDRCEGGRVLQGIMRAVRKSGRGLAAIHAEH